MYQNWVINITYVVVGKYISHNHPHSAWQMTERWRVCGDTAITEMSWVMRAHRDAGVMEMGCTMGSLYSGDPGVDRSHPYHQIIQPITHSISPNVWSPLLCLRFGGSTQLRWFSYLGSIRCFQTLSTLLEQVPHHLMTSLWMPRYVWWSIDDWLSVI